jgi:hypothetical protein
MSTALTLALDLPVVTAPPAPAKSLTRARTPKAKVEDRTLDLFAPDETPVVPPPLPAPRVYTRQETLRTFAEAPAQLALTPELDTDPGHDADFEAAWAERWGLTEAKPRRHLALVPDSPAPAPGWTCLDGAKGCARTDCREHLGAVREVRGQRFACAVDVANTLGELTDAEVAQVSGETEAFVQSVTTTLVHREPVLMAWLWALVYDHAPTLRNHVRPEWFDPEMLDLTPPRRHRFSRKPGPRRLRRVV